MGWASATSSCFATSSPRSTATASRRPDCSSTWRNRTNHSTAAPQRRRKQPRKLSLAPRKNPCNLPAKPGGYMARRITCYFTTVSPWAYIGHELLLKIAREHDVAIDWKPVNLGEVFPQTGGLPLARGAPARQRYRMFELQRWREKRGLNFALHPKHWPFDCALADRSVVAVAQSGKDAAGYVGSVFKAGFAEDRNFGKENV